jgi:hypothetical protein
MNIHAMGNISQHYLQSLFGTGSPGTSASTSSSGGSTSTLSSFAQGGNQLSPFAQVLTGLQQLEQASATQYAQVTSQISTNLQTAAQTAQTQGNTTLATQLTTLSKDFSTASQSGQLPNVQDLAQAMGSGHHHHRMGVESGSSGSTGSSGNTAGLFQYFSANGALPAGTSFNQSLNPASIILNSLNPTSSTSSVS